MKLAFSTFFRIHPNNLDEKKNLSLALCPMKKKKGTCSVLSKLSQQDLSTTGVLVNEISNIIDLIVNDGELHGITPVIILEFAVKSSNLLSREDATF